MEEFQFTVQHRAGTRHQNADALSRCPRHLQGEEITSVDSITRAVRRGIEDDPDYCPTTQTSTRCPTSSKEDATQRVWHVYAPAELAEMQTDDPDIGPIVRLRRQFEDQPPVEMVRDQSSNTKIYWSHWTRLVVRDEVVYRVNFDRVGKPCGLQLLALVSLHAELIDIVHSGLTGSHVGIPCIS